MTMMGHTFSFQGDLKDSFINAILYGLLFHLTEDNKVCKDKTERILGKEFFDKFKEKKEMLQLDHSLENFFKKCHVANDFLEMKGLFLRVYERRDKFRHVIKKGAQGKNNMIRDLSSCVIQKINGYEILNTQLKNEEKLCHEPVDIIYELVNDKDQ